MGVRHTSAPVAPAISEPGNYGFVERNTTSDGTGIPGGVGGGRGYGGHVIFYVGRPDVEAALQRAESLGGKRELGPEVNEGAGLVIGHFTDPEGHLIGVAGPALARCAGGGAQPLGRNAVNRASSEPMVELRSLWGRFSTIGAWARAAGPTEGRPHWVPPPTRRNY
jgi:predicted enzyme related to lactoylglutathione lyase